MCLFRIFLELYLEIFVRELGCMNLKTVFYDDLYMFIVSASVSSVIDFHISHFSVGALFKLK